MGRAATITKTIHGVEVTQVAFLNEIIDQIDRCGDEGATVVDIARGLGTEWEESAQARQQLAYTIANMVKRNLILRVENERGLYKVSMVARRSGVTRFDADERSILASIRDAGGICQWRDILEAHDIRPHGEFKTEALNSALYRRLTDVILKSELIRQDLGVRGVYNLPWEQVGALPLRGCWAALLTKMHYLEERQNLKLSVDLDDWRLARNTFFTNVGVAFEEARDRHNKSAEEVVLMPGIRAAVMELARRAPQEVANAKQVWRIESEKHVTRIAARYAALIENADGPDAVALLRHNQRSEVAAYTDSRIADWDSQWMCKLYLLFEKGSVGAHVHAPLTLYTAVAKTFNCCPAALSRGLVTPPMQDKNRSRPMSTRRTSMQKMEDDVISEIIDERQRRSLYGDELVDAEIALEKEYL